MKNDAPLRRLVASCGHDPDRLRKRLLDDAVLRQRYLAPLIRLWCVETIKELNQ